MADVKQTANGIIVPLTKPMEKKFLSGKSSASVEYTVNNAPDVLLALIKDTPFPDRPIQLSEISAKAAAGSGDIQFASGGGTASFKGSARASSGLAVYPDPRVLLRDLGFDQDNDISEGLQLTRDPKSNYILLRWGYEVGANAKAGVVFGGPASASATAGGKSEGIFAVVRQLPKNTGASTAIYETAQSWLLPLHIASVDDLEPGTWIIAEVDSSVAVGIEAQYGFDFSWVKETSGLGLTGDIGLRLALGAKAAFGFQAASRFAVVVSRDSVRKQDKRIRIRLFKQRQNGWNFAMDAQVSAQADVSKFLPADFDDFIKAVFGTHGAQILKDLEAIEKWTDPNQDLSNMLAGVGSKYFKKFVQDTTGVDPDVAFNEAKTKLKTLLDKWHALDHTVASLLWKYADKKANLTKIRTFNNKLKDANPEKVRAFLRKEIEKVDFFQTLGGQFLLALLPQDNILSALTDSEVFKKIQAGAEKVAPILDGGTLLDTLVKLQDNINKRLNLKQIEQVVNDTDLESLDNWLQVKLSRFLDDKLKLSRLEEVRKTIHLLTSRKQEFYDQAQRALNRKYGFGFNSTFQKSTTSAALIDVTIDTAKATAGSLIKDALLGRFDKILAKPIPGVILHEGSLTHGVRVQSAVDISLPFFRGSSAHLNDSLANAKALDEVDGRVFLYDLKAADTVIDNHEQISALTVGGNFRTLANSVRVHNPHALAYAYSFQQFRPAMKAADLKFQIKPYVETYLPNAFPNGSVDAWVHAIEEEAERLAPNGAGIIGDTLLYLELNLTAEAASAWMRAPKDKNAPEYNLMSRNIQRRLRQLIPFFYFQNLKNYEKEPAVSAALLTYAATPLVTNFKNDKFESDSGTYWDWENEKLQRFLLEHPRTKRTLKVQLQDVYNLLKATPGMEKLAEGTYKPDQSADADKVGSLYNNVLDNFKSGKTKMHFHSLFFVEATIIRAAVQAGTSMAEFLQKSSTEPSRAVKLLADFGTSITSAFNEKFISIYGDGAIRPLGTMLYLEAAQAFLPPNAQKDVSTLLNLTVLKPDAKFKPDRRTRPGSIPNADILVAKQVVEAK